MADNTQTQDNSQQSTSNAALQGLFPIISQAQNPTNPVTGLTDNHADILQGLLDKVYKQHAQDAINQVGPQQMQQLADTHQATSQLFGGGQPDPTAGATGSFQVPTGQTQSTPKTSAQPPVTSPTSTSTPIQATPEEGQTPPQYKQAQALLAQQALNEAKPKNWLQRFTDQFNQRTGGITQADRIANMQGMQKIVGGEQIQPKDIATFNVDQWKAGLDATKSSLAAEAQNMSNLVDLHGKLEATKGRPKQLLGWPSDDQTKVVGKIDESYGNVAKLINNIKTFTDNPVQIAGGGVVNPQAANITNEVQGGQKVGKYTLVNTK